MSDMKQSIESDAFWIKTVFIIMFSVIYRILDLVVLFLVVVQWGFTLVTGQKNPALGQFSDSLATYIAQIVRYVTGNDEAKPFPFTDWPASTPDVPAQQQ